MPLLKLKKLFRCLKLEWLSNKNVIDIFISLSYSRRSAQ